jgi:5-hydroxyisourate hydrolase
MASLSTHVLDIARGAPAAGIDVALWHIGGHPRELGRGITDADGRIAISLGGTLPRGVYELRFFVRSYFDGLQTPSFYDEIPVRFSIVEDAHYHVPLLLSPHGYSTYRGS